MKRSVLFIQGGGPEAHKVDATLAKSLEAALGSDFKVRYPQMPDEDNPDIKTWKAKIATELKDLKGEIILVGHSLGGLALLKYLSDDGIEKPIAGLFLLATPAWDGKDWNYDEMKLPDDIAAKLSPIPRIFLYQRRDDEIVPFAHLALNAAKLPKATVRESNDGGHQFGNDLSDVAEDIKA